jgi:hypothetical protein
MKYEHLLTIQDRADLAEADRLMVEGRKLRARVFGRLRGRAYRSSKADKV